MIIHRVLCRVSFFSPNYKLKLERSPELRLNVHQVGGMVVGCSHGRFSGASAFDHILSRDQSMICLKTVAFVCHELGGGSNCGPKISRSIQRAQSNCQAFFFFGGARNGGTPVQIAVRLPSSARGVGVRLSSFKPQDPRRLSHVTAASITTVTK